MAQVTESSQKSVKGVAGDVKKRTMKGVILAGGTGSRLAPLTKVTNKHLLPVYDKPMIYYPLQTLASSGIQDILIVSGRGHAGHFLDLLGSGSEFGLRLSYEVQEEAGGIAQALALAEDFADGAPLAVILGDNIFEQTYPDQVKAFLRMSALSGEASTKRAGAGIKDALGAMLFLKQVPDAQRFGVASVDAGHITKIVEKPTHPTSDLAVTGLYFYDARVFSIIKNLKPSGRGELEITDVNNAYLQKGQLSYHILDGFWSDAGTFESLHRASAFVRNQRDSEQRGFR